MNILTELPLGEGNRAVHRIGGADLCNLLDMSPEMLSKLRKKGVAIHLAHDSWDMELTVRNYVNMLRGRSYGNDGELTATGEKARLLRAQADREEIRVAQLRSDLVPSSEVEREWRGILADLRAEFLALPSRIGTNLPELSASDVAKIDREIRDTLTSLAEGGSDAD